MADSEMFPGVPAWVIPAGLFGVVILAMLSGRSSGGGSALAQTSYQAVPADPNLTALSAQESNNLTDAFKSVVGYVENESISQLAAGRDIALETLHADSDNRKTAAALDATIAQTNAQMNIAYANDAATVGVAGINANANVTQTAAQTAAAVAVANSNNSASVTNTRTTADANKAIAGISENTQKAVSKNGVWDTALNVVGSVAKVGGSILKVFGL
jgi:hypothetical protein